MEKSNLLLIQNEVIAMHAVQLLLRHRMRCRNLADAKERKKQYAINKIPEMGFRRNCVQTNENEGKN